MRAIRSVGPPGGNGTIIRTGRLGKLRASASVPCACDGDAVINASAQAATTANIGCISSPPRRASTLLGERSGASCAIQYSIPTDAVTAESERDELGRNF